jgi:hypothetical protein
MNTGWLTATNILLGLATLLILGIVAVATVREIIGHIEVRRLRARALRRSLDLRNLGVTLPDGGTPVDERTLPPPT